jgi:CO/xanthine dehydrogenase FAD-binding subunit
MEFINTIDYTEGASGVAAILAAEELTLGSDLRASEEYRKELCKALVRLCIKEVLP